MVQRGLSSLDQQRFFHTRKKSLEQESNLSVSNFLERVEITSVGLKLDRPQLQHWLFIVFRSENANGVACLPVPMSYDCVYDSAGDSSSPFEFW